MRSDRNIQTHSHGYRGGGVQHVVSAGHAQAKLSQVGAMIVNMEAAQRKAFAIAGAEASTGDAEVHVVMGSVGEYAAAHLRQQVAQILVVGAGHNHSVKRHEIHELRGTPAPHRAMIAIAIHVLAIDVGHHREMGDSLRNERSLSSASATRYFDLPSRAFEPMASTRPPTTTVDRVRLRPALPRSWRS